MSYNDRTDSIHSLLYIFKAAYPSCTFFPFSRIHFLPSGFLARRGGCVQDCNATKHFLCTILPRQVSPTRTYTFIDRNGLWVLQKVFRRSITQGLKGNTKKRRDYHAGGNQSKNKMVSDHIWFLATLRIFYKFFKWDLYLFLRLKTKSWLEISSLYTCVSWQSTLRGVV